MRRLWKRVIYSTLVITLVGVVIVIDYADRHVLHSVNLPAEEWDMLYPDGILIDNVQAYQSNFNNPKLAFPRDSVEAIVLYNNQFVIGRLTAYSFPKDQVSEVVELFNNPDNFSWGETTWSNDEAEYILRFYNSDGDEIGKVFICDQGCGMTRSYPFSPNMKFGGLSDKGKAALHQLLDKTNRL